MDKFLKEGLGIPSRSDIMVYVKKLQSTYGFPMANKILSLDSERLRHIKKWMVQKYQNIGSHERYNLFVAEAREMCNVMRKIM